MLRWIAAVQAGRRLEVLRQCGALASELRYARMDALLAPGTSVFLKSVMARLYAISDGVFREFMLSTDVVSA
jgi:hypothetical protein